MRTRTLILLPAASFIALAGCAHSKPALKNPASMARTASTQAPAVLSRTLATNGPRQQHLRPGALYFDLDSALLTDQDRFALQKAAAQLRRQPGRKVRIEGNCDERGTDAYNLALGEERALAAKRYLARLGIDRNRLRTLSYGKQRPRYPGHDEASWARNRRDDLVVELH